MIYDKARMLPLNCKNPNVSDDALFQFQQAQIIPSRAVEVTDAKVLRQQKLKEAKSVVKTTTPKNTKRAVETKIFEVPVLANSKKSKTSVVTAVIQDVHDTRDDQIAELKLQVQLLLGAKNQINHPRQNLNHNSRLLVTSFYRQTLIPPPPNVFVSNPATAATAFSIWSSRKFLQR